MIKINIVISCALALIITGVLGQNAYTINTGWQQSNGNWYYYQNNCLKTGWIMIQLKIIILNFLL